MKRLLPALLILAALGAAAAAPPQDAEEVDLLEKAQQALRDARELLNRQYRDIQRDLDEQPEGKEQLAERDRAARRLKKARAVSTESLPDASLPGRLDEAGWPSRELDGRTVVFALSWTPRRGADDRHCYTPQDAAVDIMTAGPPAERFRALFESGTAAPLWKSDEFVLAGRRYRLSWSDDEGEPAFTLSLAGSKGGKARIALRDLYAVRIAAMEKDLREVRLGGGLRYAERAPDGYWYLWSRRYAPEGLRKLDWRSIEPGLLIDADGEAASQPFEHMRKRYRIAREGGAVRIDDAAGQ